MVMARQSDFARVLVRVIVIDQWCSSP